MDEAEMEREAATEAALQALEMLEEFDVEVCATARVSAQTKVLALDLEHAAKKVAAWGNEELNELDYNKTDDDYDGDECAYIVDDKGNQVDLVLKADDTPFSWDAVSIIKMIAETEPDEHERLQDLYKQARRACGKVD